MTYHRGVAFSGMENRREDRYLPGRPNTDYLIPREAMYRYFSGKGLTLVRLAVAMERLQPVPFGELDEAHCKIIDEQLALAVKYGMQLFPEPHGYGGRRIKGKGVYKFGSPELPIEAFADFWHRMAIRFKGKAGLYGFDLMNEPTGMPVTQTATTYKTTATVTRMYQAAIDAIRATGFDRTLVLETDRWAGLQSFKANFGADPEVWWHDPLNNSVLSFHYYQDPDYSGTYSKPWTQALHDRIEGQMRFVGEWAKRRGVRILLGEYGVPSTPEAEPYRRDLDHILSIADSYGWDGCYWAAGWGYTSPPTIQPTDNYTKDRSVMAVVVKHLGKITAEPAPVPEPTPEPAPTPAPIVDAHPFKIGSRIAISFGTGRKRVRPGINPLHYECKNLKPGAVLSENLLTTDGVQTGVTLTLASVALPYRSFASNNQGDKTLVLGPYTEAGDLGESWSGRGNVAPQGYTLAGLPAGRYTVFVAGSCPAAGTPRTATVTAGGQSARYDAAAPSAAALRDVAPVDGVVRVDVLADPGAVGHVGMLVLERIS